MAGRIVTAPLRAIWRQFREFAVWLTHQQPAPHPETRRDGSTGDGFASAGSRAGSLVSAHMAQSPPNTPAATIFHGFTGLQYGAAPALFPPAREHDKQSHDLRETANTTQCAADDTPAVH